MGAQCSAGGAAMGCDEDNAMWNMGSRARRWSPLGRGLESGGSSGWLSGVQVSVWARMGRLNAGDAGAGGDQSASVANRARAESAMLL